jgi:hypothetical protein
VTKDGERERKKVVKGDRETGEDEVVERFAKDDAER